jgi:hypothetical protein
MPQYIVYYHGQGDDSETVTADDEEHAEEVFREDIEPNLWAENIEITEVELLEDEPDPPAEPIDKRFLHASIRVAEIDAATIEQWLIKLKSKVPADEAAAFQDFGVSRNMADDGWSVWAHLERGTWRTPTDTQAAEEDEGEVTDAEEDEEDD